MNRKKRLKRALRKPFETGGFLLLRTMIPLLPRKTIIAISKGAGRLAVKLPIRENNFALQNLDAVFGDTRTPEEKREILRSSFATFCQTMLDVFWFSHNPEKRIDQYVTFENSPELDALFDSNQAAVCITAHLGSWELLGQTCALKGLDLASIAATVKNDAVDRALIEQRERTGQTIIPQKGALRTLVARFRKNGKAAFVLDQNTAADKGGIKVNFLGLPMSVSSAPAALAYRTSTQIVLGFCLPEPGGRYRIRGQHRIVPPPFEKDADADRITLELTQQIQDIISAEIRKNPGYWLWSYRHWRREPGESYPAHYPNY